MSTVIKRYLYDASAGTLLITFPSGLSYLYFDVPAEIHAALAAAESKGAYFNAHIRDVYFHQELD